MTKSGWLRPSSRLIVLPFAGESYDEIIVIIYRYDLHLNEPKSLISNNNTIGKGEKSW
jgi:hypothetical protein